jgi:hypothetical protein
MKGSANCSVSIRRDERVSLPRSFSKKADYGAIRNGICDKHVSMERRGRDHLGPGERGYQRVWDSCRFHEWVERYEEIGRADGRYDIAGGA